jgi:hypothetical protein
MRYVTVSLSLLAPARCLRRRRFPLSFAIPYKEIAVKAILKFITKFIFR